MRVYLIHQSQLEDKFHNKRITRVTIQRMDEKRWVPLFETTGTNGKPVICSVRIQSAHTVRTWANLTLLAEWLREKFSVERCDLLLSDELPLMEKSPL